MQSALATSPTVEAGEPGGQGGQIAAPCNNQPNAAVDRETESSRPNKNVLRFPAVRRKLPMRAAKIS